MAKDTAEVKELEEQAKAELNEAMPAYKEAVRVRYCKKCVLSVLYMNS